MTFRVKDDLLKVHHGVRIEQQIQVLQRLRREEALHLIVGQQIGFGHIRIFPITELRFAVFLDGSEDLISPLTTPHLSLSPLLHIDRVFRHCIQHIQRFDHFRTQQIALPVRSHLHSLVIRKRHIFRR